MSKPSIDSDGFQTVVTKKASKNKQTVVPRDFANLKIDDNIDIHKIVRRIQLAAEELKDSLYLKEVYQSVSTHLKSRKVVEIVCFGLGHVGECNISWYQTGLLLCLKDRFQPSKCSVHDPIFTKCECEILKGLGLEIIGENTEGAYVTSDEDVTLIYFPHCPKQLTNNFLWSNWSNKLENCILICNSLTSILENNPSRVLKETVPYIFKIFPYFKESKLDNTFRFTDIFNDTSVHSFPCEQLEKIPIEFWTKTEKPKYNNTEEFITSLMIDKLKL